MKYTNRIVAVASALLALALAILPVVGNFDWQSTAGCIGGIIAVLGITQKWLDGWQAHEARTAVEAVPVPAVPPSPAVRRKPTKRPS